MKVLRLQVMLFLEVKALTIATVTKVMLIKVFGRAYRKS
jgi:hypothetical protein